jgi:hypothetical protein
VWLAFLSLGQGLYQPAMAHYAAREDLSRTTALLSRLRTLSSILQAALPFVAGVWIEAAGRRLGFEVSLAAYLAAAAIMYRLPRRSPPGLDGVEAPNTVAGWLLPGPIRRSVIVVAVFSGLAWIANMLYTAYVFINLHAGPAGFGLALALWGGAGLLSAWALQHVDMKRLDRLTWVWLALMAAAWGIMTLPVGFWIVALLGIPEGFATWLLFDLLQARVLTLAPADQRGRWTAIAAGWNAGGQIAGLSALLVAPVFLHVHRGFLVIAVLMTAMAITAGLLPAAKVDRRAGQASSASDPSVFA